MIIATESVPIVMLLQDGLLLHLIQEIPIHPFFWLALKYFDPDFGPKAGMLLYKTIFPIWACFSLLTLFSLSF